MKSLRGIIIQTIYVWGVLSFEELMELMNKRFFNPPEDIIRSIIDSLMEDGVIVENYNKTFSDRSYWDAQNW